METSLLGSPYRMCRDVFKALPLQPWYAGWSDKVSPSVNYS